MISNKFKHYALMLTMLSLLAAHPFIFIYYLQSSLEGQVSLLTNITGKLNAARYDDAAKAYEDGYVTPVEKMGHGNKEAFDKQYAIVQKTSKEAGDSFYASHGERLANERALISLFMVVNMLSAILVIWLFARRKIQNASDLSQQNANMTQ